MVARRRLIGPLCAVVILFSATAQGADPRPIEIIEDNSFLLEEAYNQEPGVVQHIFQYLYSGDSRQRGWTFAFTQEWPIYGQDHQFSYTILAYHLINDGQRQHGVGDTLLNYIEDNINGSGRAVRTFNPLLSPGFRAAVVNENDLQIVAGAGVPIGLNRQANNLAAFLY